MPNFFLQVFCSSETKHPDSISEETSVNHLSPEMQKSLTWTDLAVWVAKRPWPYADFPGVFNFFL